MTARRRRRLTAAAAGLAALVAIQVGAPAPASAGQVRPLAEGVDDVIVSSKLVVVDLRPGVIRVMPLGSAPFDVAIDESCSARAAFGTDVLVNCSRGSDEIPYLLRATDRSFTPIAGWEPGDLFSQIGRHWYGGSQFQGRPHYPSFVLNRTTGERVWGSYDLNAPDVRPWPKKPSPHIRVAPDLVLFRRGHRPLRVSHCRRGCPAVAFDRTRIAWVERGAVHFMRLRTRRTTSWRFPPALLKDATLQFAGPRRLIVISTTPTGQNAYAIRLPAAG